MHFHAHINSSTHANIHMFYMNKHHHLLLHQYLPLGFLLCLFNMEDKQYLKYSFSLTCYPRSLFLRFILYKYCIFHPYSSVSHTLVSSRQEMGNCHKCQHLAIYMFKYVYSKGHAHGCVQPHCEEWRLFTPRVSD